MARRKPPTIVPRFVPCDLDGCVNGVKRRWADDPIWKIPVEQVPKCQCLLDHEAQVQKR